jgi:DNA repair protein RadA/Sms
MGQERLREAAKHGFNFALIANANAPKDQIKGIEVIAVSRLSDAIDWILNNYAR